MYLYPNEHFIKEAKLVVFTDDDDDDMVQVSLKFSVKNFHILTKHNQQLSVCSPTYWWLRKMEKKKKKILYKPVLVHWTAEMWDKYREKTEFRKEKTS